MNFRLNADMYVCTPKVQLAHYVDNTMPRRDWSRFDAPSYLRMPPRAARPSAVTQDPAFLRRQA